MSSKRHAEDKRIDGELESSTPIRRYSSERTSGRDDAEAVIHEKDTMQPEPTYVPPAEVRKETVEERKRAWYHPLSLFQLALDNWFLIGIFVFIVLASQFPNVAKTGGREWSFSVPCSNDMC